MFSSSVTASVMVAVALTRWSHVSMFAINNALTKQLGRGGAAHPPVLDGSLPGKSLAV
jgi:hypothetical protein